MNAQITTSKVVSIAVAVLVAVAVMNYDKLMPHKWRTYNAPDGSFSIELPGEPTVKTVQIPAEGGSTRVATILNVEATKSTGFTCTYIDDESIQTKSPDQAFESTRDGSLRETQGTLISQERLTIQGFPAVDVHASAAGNSLLDSRMVLAGKRLYMIVAESTPAEGRDPTTIRRVLDSFKILSPSQDGQ
jgi:hypothetical protein